MLVFDWLSGVAGLLSLLGLWDWNCNRLSRRAEQSHREFLRHLEEQKLASRIESRVLIPFEDTGTDPLWMQIVGIPVDVWMELKTPEDWSRAIWNREHGLWATRDGSHFFERTGRDVGTWQPEVFDQESNAERVSVYVDERVEPVAEFTIPEWHDEQPSFAEAIRYHDDQIRQAFGTMI